MSITIRKIKQNDNKELAELIRIVFREFKIDMPGTVYTDPTTDSLYELFTKPASIYWVLKKMGNYWVAVVYIPLPALRMTVQNWLNCICL
jgi:hypothetical protein